MNSADLRVKIGIPERIIPALQGKTAAVQNYSDLILQLTDPDRAEEAYEALAKQLGDDDMAMLACQLEAAAICCDRYMALGVSEQLMVDTMKCFARFLGETKTMTGVDKFDREWWTWRQISGRLFRIGELEYERLPETKEISLHIPSDAVFTPENVDVSLAEAKAFFRRFFPEYADSDYVCHSWLLAPKLQELLPESSNIVQFQKRFQISHVEPDNRDYIGWLFRVKFDTPVEDLPEHTTLQKKTKQLILSGGNIGEAGGKIRETQPYTVL